MSDLLARLTIFSLAGVFYAYAVYPALAWLLSRFAKQSDVAALHESAALPSVAILIAAHNEQQWIGDRVANALAADYPNELLSVVIASDGSEDGTNEIVERCSTADGRVKLIPFPQRRGKATTLNDAMLQIEADIVAFSDANTMYEPDALRRLVGWFADERIGAVCGRLVLHDPATGKNVDSLYWRYETFIKKCEARLGGLLGANGAIYAIRRQCYEPLPGNAIVDDFMIPLLAKLRHRCRLVYDMRAVAHEETPPSIGDEFRRRVRIGAGGFQSLATLWPLLSPRYGWTAFALWNHKVLRWFVPALMATAFIANLLIWRVPPFEWLLAAQLTFYLLACAGVWIGGQSLPAKLARAASLFCSMNAALAVGFWQWLLVRQRGTWRRTIR